MVIDAHQLMHEDGGIGEIEHISMYMDSATRELLSETGSYHDADADTRLDHWPIPPRGRRMIA